MRDEYFSPLYQLIFSVPVQEPGVLEPEAKEPPVRAPEVTQEPQNLVTDEGEPVTFTCRIRGSPGKFIHLLLQT